MGKLTHREIEYLFKDIEFRKQQSQDFNDFLLHLLYPFLFLLILSLFNQLFLDQDLCLDHLYIPTPLLCVPLGLVDSSLQFFSRKGSVTSGTEGLTRVSVASPPTPLPVQGRVVAPECVGTGLEIWVSLISHS